MARWDDVIDQEPVRHLSLDSLQGLLKAYAWGSAVVALLVFGSTLLAGIMNDGLGFDPWWLWAGAALFGSIGWITFSGFSGLIGLLIDVEENTRATAIHVARLAEGLERSD